jgi:hypothetical protein
MGKGIIHIAFSVSQVGNIFGYVENPFPQMENTISKMDS